MQKDKYKARHKETQRETMKIMRQRESAESQIQIKANIRRDRDTERHTYRDRDTER